MIIIINYDNYYNYFHNYSNNYYNYYYIYRDYIDPACSLICLRKFAIRRYLKTFLLSMNIRNNNLITRL